MNKYFNLVEYLKSDYLNQKYNSDKKEQPLDPPSEFNIASISYEETTGMLIKVYEIEAKAENRAWNVMITPASFLYAASKEKLRAKLLEEHTVKGVFTLKNVFFKSSTIPTAVIIFGNNNGEIWLTSAMDTKDVIVLMKDIGAYKRKVYFTKQLNSKNFMPEFYNGEIDKINTTLDKYETKELQDIAEIISGKNAKPELLSDEGIPYLRGRNLRDGKIVDVDSFVIPDVVEEFSNVLLEEGDILLQKQFGYHKIARVEVTDLPAIASSGLFIIRAFDVPENYLFTYLTSETGKAMFDKQLKSIERGASIVSIGLTDLKKVRVPIYDEATMDAFVNIECVKVSDIMSRTKRLLSYATMLKNIQVNAKGETELEEKVVTAFLDRGWNSEEVRINSVIVQSAIPRPWETDIALLNEGELFAIVEVRSSIYLMNHDWLNSIKAIIESKVAPFLILSNGTYYEIHFTRDGGVHKMMSPPTKDMLLSILNGKEVK